MMKHNSIALFTIACCFFSLGKANAQGVVITSGSNLVMNGTATMVINDGSLINNGTFTPANSSILFTGTASSSNTFINGSSTTSFYNLGLNKSAGAAKLLRNISVSSNLLMGAGNLDLNGFDIDLGSTGSINGESLTSYITGTSGTVNRTVTLNAPTSVNPGNIGIEITSTANLGSTTIKRGVQQQISGSGYSINRYYDVIPTNNTALNATVRMYYFDAELAGINETELKVWSLSTALGSIWTLLGSDLQSTSLNYVQKNSINQLYRFTLASSISHPLPVQFVSFHAQLQNNSAKLDWSTSFELNNKHFEVERSADGKNFLAIGKVNAVGNSNIVSNYVYTDANPFDNATYYRLKQVSSDGSFIYSKVVSVTKGAYTNAILNVYPNPVTGPVDIKFTSIADTKAIAQITDSKGIVLLSRTIAATKGVNNITINMAALAQGTYYLRIIGIDNKAIALIKN